jgi:Ca2+-binding RTX toxin-like protein
MATKTGGAGNDTIWGTQWADILKGNGGNDYLTPIRGFFRLLFRAADSSSITNTLRIS